MIATGPDHIQGRDENPLDSLWGTVIAGVVLTAMPVRGRQNRDGRLTWNSSSSGWAAGFHIAAGFMWVGLLYYFNFVNAAADKAATADGTGPASRST